MEKGGPPMGIETEEPNQKPPTFWQMLHSVMAAAFGVVEGSATNA